MSDKCPKCGSAALSPDHPKWFECGTIGDRRGTFHHTTTCHYFSEFRKPLDDRIKRLEDAGQRVEDAAYSIQDWSGTALGDALDELNKAKEANP